MKLLVTEASIIAPGSPYHSKTCDLLINNGIFEKISTKRIPLPKGYKTFKARGLHLSPGWFDMHVHVPDPGHEYRETISSACEAAAAGGYTGIAVVPATQPPVQSKSEVKYLLKQAASQAVHVYPVGAISKNLLGKELAEMYDMQQAGAVAFSEGDQPLTHAGLMLRALLYAKGFDALIVSRPLNIELAGTSMVNESRHTTLLGLKGIPAIAEEVAIARDLELVKYTGSRIHFSKLSTAGSVELIRKAKKEKLPVTCDVSINNLVLTDESLREYDTNLKLTPPLRTESDKKALLKGLKDGTIDALVSDHNPQDTETKQVEFDYAAYGAIGLQTCYALWQTWLSDELTLEQLIEKIAINPRKILGIAPVQIAEEAVAEFTLFDSKAKWTFNKENNHSLSGNSYFLDHELKGKIMAVFTKDQLIINP